MSAIQWRCSNFQDLSPRELYAILQLRLEVFVVEQKCIFQDIDDCDQQALHLCGYSDRELLCYSRILPPGIKYPAASIGRVVTRKSARRDGIGRRLVQNTLAYCEQFWPGTPVTISAQQYLEKFYLELGFSTVSEPYLEDGITHIEMRLQATE